MVVASLVLAVIVFAAFYAYFVIYKNGPGVTQTAPCNAPGVTCGTAPAFEIVSASLYTTGNGTRLGVAIHNMEQGVYPENITVFVSSNNNVSVAQMAANTSPSAWESAIDSTLLFNFTVPGDNIQVMSGKVYAVRVFACIGNPSSCSTNQIDVTAQQLS